MENTSFPSNTGLLQMNLRGRLLFLLAPPAIAAAVHALLFLLVGHAAAATVGALCGAVAAGVIGWMCVDEPFACAVEPMLWALGVAGVAALAYAYVATGVTPATFAAIGGCVAAFAAAIAVVPITSATIDDGRPSASELWQLRMPCLAMAALGAAVCCADQALVVAASGGLLLAACAAIAKIAPLGQLSLD